MLLRSVVCVLFLLLSSFSLIGKALYYEVEHKGNYLEKELAYCVPGPTTPWNDYIASVILGTINNTNQSDPSSTNSTPQGVGNYTNLNTDLIIGFSEGIVADIQFDGSAAGTGYFTLWIDLNGDQDFDDPFEMMIDNNYTLVANTSNTFNVAQNIAIPSSATPGTTRMRLIVKRDNAPSPCESGFLGEVEDYTINLISGTTDTTPPTPTLSGPVNTSGDFNVDIVFDEAVTSIPLVSDFTIINGTINNIGDLGTGTTFNANVTPINPGNVSVTLNANAVQDTAGNGNLVSNTYVCEYIVLPLSLTLTSTPESAVGASDGTITVLESGGVTPYTYDWAHLPGTNDPSDLTGLTSDTYFLTLTDNLGTSATASETINVATPTGNVIDLSIMMMVDDYSADAFENRTYTIKVRNDKIGTASDVKLLIPLDPNELVPEVGNPPVASAGTYDVNTGIWDVGTVNFGTAEILQLFLTTQISEPTLYAQVNEVSAGDTDVDSTPGNGVPPNVVEDDEAKVVLGVGPVFPSNRTRYVKLKKKLDASYTAVTDYVLRFTYEEDYHVQNVIDDVLEYQIYNVNYEPVNNASGILPNKYGVNWQELSLGSMIGSLPGQAAFYVLEVKNLNKEETYFLRFQYVTP